MALKLLLIDPDDEWLSSASEFFKEQMYEVSVVNNGKDAQLTLYNDQFFAIVLNLHVKNHPGVQVLKFIKSNYTNQKVILVVDKGDGDYEIDVEKYKKMGATEVLEKPFEMADVKALLEGHQSIGDLVSNLPRREGASAEENVEMGDDEFTAVRISEFYSSKAVLFNVYVRLKENKYIKILHAGDSFDKDRIDKYKNEKGVEFLYFHNSDRRKFIQFHNHLAKKLVNADVVPTESKLKMIKNVTAKYVEELYDQGMKPQVIDQGKQVAENVYTLIENDDSLYKTLRGYQEFDPNAYTHCYLVTLFSSAIIKQFDWQSKATIETTAMACMFHDIGKMDLPPELLELRPVEMDDEQLEMYKQHPELGAARLDGCRQVNNSVKQIISQHHECFDGSGYPFGKKGSKIHTLANIVRLADDFVHIMVDEELKPVEALKKIIGDKEIVVRYNSMIVENFIKVFADPSKIIGGNKTTLPSNSKVVKKAS